MDRCDCYVRLLDCVDRVIQVQGLELLVLILETLDQAVLFPQLLNELHLLIVLHEDRLLHGIKLQFEEIELCFHLSFISQFCARGSRPQKFSAKRSLPVYIVALHFLRNALIGSKILIPDVNVFP